jgi:hypothetical protein
MSLNAAAERYRYPTDVGADFESRRARKSGKNRGCA